MKVFKMIEKMIETITKSFFFMIIILVFVAAILRKLTGHVPYVRPIPWAYNVATILFAYVIFLGADQTLRANGHIGIDFVLKLFPVKYQRAVLIFNHIVIMVFLALLVGFGIYVCVVNKGMLLTPLNISMSWAKASVPIGCFLMLITVSRKLISLLKGENLDKKITEDTGGETEC